MLAIQELWELKSIPSLPGFQPLIFKSRNKGNGGGVGFFIRHGFKFTQINTSFNEKNLESIAIDIQLNKHKSVRIINVYVNPTVKLHETILNLKSLPTNNNCVVIGDFNLNLFNNRNCELIESFHDRGMTQQIDQATRVVHTVRGESRSLIDLSFTNIKLAKSYIITSDMSDHFSICTTINNKWRKCKEERVDNFIPSQDQRSTEYLRQWLAARDWKDVINDNTKK